MKTITNWKDISGSTKKIGRTLDKEEFLAMNWTMSGIRFAFTGSTLCVSMRGIPGVETDIDPVTGAAMSRKVYPRIGIMLDDEDRLVQEYTLEEKEKRFCLIETLNEERHTVTILKLTENYKGKAELLSFLSDGCIGPAEDRPRLRLEVIGDSITCGFGNMVNDPDRLFYDGDENGFYAYPAVAARLMDAELSVLSVSGICLSEGTGKLPWPLSAMPRLYPFTDAPYEEDTLQEEPQAWDFGKNKADIVVINLGTNDASLIELNGDIANGVTKYEEDYIAFLREIRRLNGPDTRIVCALGSMDYYLYDSILKAAERYRRDEGDDKIFCFKFARMRAGDGAGAARHPHRTTHARMGRELAAFLRQLTGETGR